jgi:hypothetical protein
MLEEGGNRSDPPNCPGLDTGRGIEPNPTGLKRFVERPGSCLFLGDGDGNVPHRALSGLRVLLEPNPAVIDLFETMGCGDDGNFHVVRTEACPNDTTG